MFFSKIKKGFTLIEVLFVVIVIAILASIALSRITTTTGTAKANACKANQSTMNMQIEQYRLDTGDWPATLAAVTENTTYFPDGAPTCPEGGAYSMNGTSHRTDCDVVKPVDHSLN
ncbi:prepilin-type N-terminal cleavage/methylation domain-containing protein [bacterium]|nr:prepilin-type N-terminal cleavage/methylation domain-containing protein [bacterium]